MSIMPLTRHGEGCFAFPHMKVSLELRRAVKASGKPIKQIAVKAGVSYMILSRWHRGFTTTIDADIAETVYRSLTGKGFVS